MDKLCKHCKRALPRGGEYTLTICGEVIGECLICALLKNNVITDYWGFLSAEMQAEVQKVKEELNL